MRSLATISSVPTCAAGAAETSPRSYISRTFPLAIRGSSASVGGTSRDSTSARRPAPPAAAAARRRARESARGGARGAGSYGRARRRLEPVEPRDDLLRVAHERRVVEDRVEVEAAGALVGREQLAKRHALVPRALRERLRDAVRLVARAPALSLWRGCDEREQHPLGEQRAVGELEVLAHARRVDRHVAHERDRAVLQVVEQDRRVRQDHALDRRVRDVALVPQRDVLERRLRVAAQYAREARDLLALDRVALVRHRRGALLARAERLL